MGDPFSIPGAAVGVISLGLTVCQGLLAYYGPYKSFHEEIANTLCRAKSLSKTLSVLKEILDDAENQNITDEVESARIAIEMIKHCEHRLKSLDRMLQKCRKVTPTQDLVRSKLCTDRILYPFRRDSLVALVEMLNGLQMNLNTSLQVLSYETTRTNKKDIGIAISHSTAAATAASQVLGVVRDIHQRNSDFEGKLNSIDSRLIQTETSIVQHQTHPVMTPDLLRMFLDSQREVDEGINRVRLNISPGMSSRCKCNHNNVLSTRQTRHSGRNRCRCHISDRRLASISAQHTFCNWLLRCCVTVSLEITHGAGGLSISPGLRFRAVVPANAAVFTLLSNNWHILWKEWTRKRSFKVNDTLQDTSKGLLEMFRGGSASPTDALPNGDTILHVVARWHEITRYWGPDLNTQWRNLIKALVSNGAAVNIVNNNGETPVDILMHGMWGCCLGMPMEQSSVDICSDLVSAGGYISPIGVSKCTQLKFYDNEVTTFPTRLMRDMSAFVVQRVAARAGFEGDEIPEQLGPALSQSKSDLECLLRDGVELAGVLDYYVQWPVGLTLLLDSGLTPSSRTLAAAFGAKCKDSIKLLLKTKSMCMDCNWLQIVSCSNDREILALAVREFASRRRSLQILAESHLPSQKLSQLRIQPGCLLDSTAADAYRFLKAACVDIEFPEHATAWLVYRQISSNLALADLLWEAGFRDANGRDHNGFTCLMVLKDKYDHMDGLSALLQKAQWLISKGADPHEDRNGCPAAFYICYDLGIASYSLTRHANLGMELRRLSDQCLELMRCLLFDPHRDGCNCSYSPYGCSGISLFLDGFLANIYGHDESGIFDHLATALEAIASVLSPSCPRGIQDIMARDVLSFITSHALHITHTCTCHAQCAGLPDDELGELLYVEVKLHRMQEQLMHEFLTEYKNRNKTLPLFIRGYWSERISQVLSPDKEEAQNLREIGVILSDTENPDPLAN